MIKLSITTELKELDPQHRINICTYHVTPEDPKDPEAEPWEFILVVRYFGEREHLLVMHSPEAKDIWVKYMWIDEPMEIVFDHHAQALLYWLLAAMGEPRFFTNIDTSKRLHERLMNVHYRDLGKEEEHRKLVAEINKCNEKHKLAPGDPGYSPVYEYDDTLIDRVIHAECADLFRE